MVINLSSYLPGEDGSMYHIVFEKFLPAFVYFSICEKMDLQALQHSKTIDA